MPRKKSSPTRAERSPTPAFGDPASRAAVERRAGAGRVPMRRRVSEPASALIGTLEALEGRARATARRLERIADDFSRLRAELAHCAGDLTALSISEEDT